MNDVCGNVFPDAHDSRLAGLKCSDHIDHHYFRQQNNCIHIHSGNDRIVHHYFHQYTDCTGEAVYSNHICRHCLHRHKMDDRHADDGIHLPVHSRMHSPMSV